MAWPTYRLGEIFDIARGGSPRPIDKYITDDPDGVNWIMIGDVAPGAKTITKTRKRILKSGASRSRYVKPGDFLLTNSMSFGRPYISGIAGCIHDGWLVLSKKSQNIDENYFYYLLGSKTVYSEFERRAAGATVKNLNIEIVRDVEVRLPPLDEQRRIAAILDKAEELRAKRRAALALLDSLPTAIFREMFGDPTESNAQYPTHRLGNLCRTTSGGTPNRTRQDFYGGDIPWVKSGELHQGTILDTEEKLTEAGLLGSSAKLMPPGTILYAMYGATVGAIATLGIRASTNQAICCITPGDELDSQYLVEVLKQATPALLLKRVGGAQPNLSQDLIRNLEVPLPPLKVQQDFGRKVAAVSDHKQIAIGAGGGIEALFLSLQKAAFE